MSGPERIVVLLFFACLTSIAKGEIFVNQLGYRENDPKFIFSSEFADSFVILDATNQTVVFKNQLELFTLSDPATGMDLYKGDFSSLTSSGNYYCKILPSDSSFGFIIHDSVYNQLYKQSLKGLYFQRCGYDLLGPTVGNYYHPRCHILDGIFHSTTGSTGFHLARGGWHDAGDYGKYIVNAGISIGTLLMASEYFPGKFNRDDLNIAESGNGIPDILDEVRIELEWMLTMQNPDGGVYHKLTPEQFSPFIMPQNDNSTRFIYQVSTPATGDFAAVMARAARIFYPVDTVFANLCRNSAELAWDYLELHPTIVPPGGFSNPPGTATGVYGDSDDSDERLWAAVELYLTTGSSDYHNYFITNYNSGGLINSAMNWRNVRPMAHLTYIFGQRNDINTGIQSSLTTSLNSMCQNLVIRSYSNGFLVSINPGEYVWGCNSMVMNHALILVLGYEKFQNESFKSVALDQLHYVMGRNAHGLSFVTGSGTESPMFPHHRPSGADGIAEPVPGLLVGGPDQYLSDPVLQAHFTSSTPPALCYMDDQGSYASNEIAINWNAPLIFVSGYFAGSTSSSIEDGYRGQIIPDNFQLQQNYPNPFNSRTKIEFILSKRMRVRLDLFDVRGSFIRDLVNDDLAAGNHRVFLNAESLSSGIYWYKLSTETGELSKKMVLIK
ncbi:MAG: glycoside hydrolase family 9 protein [bacterium]|nr:MAG: glycoside hydrolase family 9 protein [bacterium]